MSKIPVFATVGRTYSFVFGNLGLLHRLCWFPFLIVILPDILPPFASKALAIRPGAIVVTAAIAIVVYVVQVFMMAMALVAIHRVILFGDRKPGVVLLFSVGVTEFYFAAVPLVLQIGLIALAFITAGILGWPDKLVPVNSEPVGLVVFLAIWAIGIWIACRFVGFYPLVVVKERIAILEAWRLSRGNFWRILGVFVVGCLPIIAVVAITSVIIVPFVLTTAEPGLSGVQAMAAKMEAISVALTFILGIPLTALGVAFLCYCFKALAGYAPNDIVPSAVLPLPIPSAERSRV